MARFETSAQGIYDTPPGGDFVRYVDRLLAQQSQWMSVGYVVNDLSAKTTAVRPGQAEGASKGARHERADEKQHPAAAILARIQELEQRRNPASARQDVSRTMPPTAKPRTPAVGFQIDESKLVEPKTASNVSVLMAAVGAIVGVIFPPLGVLMLINLWRKHASSGAKK